MLKPPEFSFDGRAAPVQVAPALRVAWHERVKARSLAPDRLRLALAGGTAPLRRLALEIGSGERPGSVLASRRLVLAAFDGRRLAKRDDRRCALLDTSGVDRPLVIALVERDCLRGEASRSEGVEQLWDGLRFMPPCCLDFPREREAGHASDGSVDAVPVNPLRALSRQPSGAPNWHPGRRSARVSGRSSRLAASRLRSPEGQRHQWQRRGPSPGAWLGAKRRRHRGKRSRRGGSHEASLRSDRRPIGTGHRRVLSASRRVPRSEQRFGSKSRFRRET